MNSWPGPPREFPPARDGDIVLAPSPSGGWSVWQLFVISDSADGNDAHWVPVGSCLDDGDWTHDLLWPVILLVRAGHAMGGGVGLWPWRRAR